MGSKRRTHLHTVGEKPHVGRRYVSDGKVRIEWRESGKRRSRTVGPNTPEVRAQADAMLEDLLRPKRATKKERAAPASRKALQQSTGEQDAGVTVGDAVRAWAVAVMDVADVLVERTERWLSQWTERSGNDEREGE